MRILIFLALVGSALADSNPIARIVGGTNATIQTFPFMANMQYGWFGIAWTQNCGGALITANSVLSAAHCFDGYIAPQWRVVLGTSERTTGGVIFNVARFTYHPDYNRHSPLDADVAIAHLETNAIFSELINTVPIASPTSILFPGMPVTIIGWGDTKYQGFRSEQLQEVSINIIDQQICAQRYADLQKTPGYESWPNITSGMACAGVLDVGGRDACVGDSGGPVVFRGTPNIIIGINSWSYGCAHPVYPGVLVRVPNYTNWIVSNA